MTVTRQSTLRSTVATVLTTFAVASAADVPWQEIADTEQQLRDAHREIGMQDKLLEVLGETIPSGRSAQLAAAREALREAEEKLADVMEESGANEFQAKLKAAQTERDDRIVELLADSPGYADTAAECAQAEARVEAFEAKLPALSVAEARELAQARAAARHLSRVLYSTRRAMWQRAEIRPLYAKADKLYKDTGSALKKLPGVADARKAVKTAQRNLAAAARPLVAADPRGKAATEERDAMAAEVDQLKAKLKALRDPFVGGPQWHHHVMVEQTPRKGKPRKPAKAELWIPPGCEVVRGAIIGHPPVLGSKLPKDSYFRLAAAEQGLAVLHFQSLDALFDYSKPTTIERFEKALADLAEKSGHAELALAPFLTVGHSTSGIFCRNVAYWKPERTIGVIHVGSGNMHHHRPDPARTLAGVPFLAENGEFEEFGPEGGIRPEYGLQTQWIMIREQMLRRRATDPAHLMSLVVNPGGGHSGWSGELSRYCALFIRKACEARIPEGKGDGKTPIRCREIDPESGWLTDADIYAPKQQPAPHGEYAGDKSEAFWHFDEEMARATAAFHDGKFLLPDPSRGQPVPADWPPRK